MTALSRLRSVEHFLVAAQSADPTTGQLWALQELQRAIVEVELQTAKNSFDPSLTAAKFDITEADIGRYVRRRSSGEIGCVRRDPGNGWLYPGLWYEWRPYRHDLEYVEIVQPPPSARFGRPAF